MFAILTSLCFYSNLYVSYRYRMDKIHRLKFLCILMDSFLYHFHSDYIFLFMQHFVLEYHKIYQIERRTLCHLKSIC